MLTYRPAGERGHIKRDWLDTNHSFSFGRYYDPEWTRFRSLRVINDDRFAAGQGFGTHPHDNMEIITYVVSGQLEHADSQGGGAVLEAGDVQMMRAGSGIAHSEKNASDQDELHLLQIWILPEKRDLEPGYTDFHVGDEEKRNTLAHIASPVGGEGRVEIHQDAHLFASILEPNQEVTHPLSSDRHAWVQVIEGSMEVNGQPMTTGDGLAVSEVEGLHFNAEDETHFLLFDLG